MSRSARLVVFLIGAGCVAAMFADGKANWFAIFGKRSSIDDEIDGGLRLITAPESNLIVDEINARAAVADFVGTNDFPHVHIDHPLHVALDRMGASQLDLLPVVSRANVHQLRGVITLQDVLEQYGVKEAMK